MANIKPILDSTKIALERAASEKFGAAVEDFSRGTLGPLLGVPATDANASADRKDGSFYASSYAAALAGGTSYRPKLKFLFKVEFVFTKEARDAFPDVLGKTNSQDFTFMVKSVDRPKIDFEYEDDINMYNFRTKVLKKIRHRELTMTFMDDTGNRVLNFFRALMMLHSPITRRQMRRQDATTLAQKLAAPDAMSVHEGNGMNFSEITDAMSNDTAIRGTVNSQIGNVIQTIRIKQMYVNPSSQLGLAAEETIFDFMNARLVSFDLDDLSHEGSDANLITMQFDYDWMEIVNVGPLTEPDTPNYNIAVPGIHGAPTDISTAGTGFTPQGGGNVFSNIITNQIGRAGQQIASSAINKAVETIAGKGHFASLISSQASNILGGLVGAAGRNVSTSFVNQGVSMISQGASGLINQAGAAFSNMNIIKPPGATTNASASATGTTSVFDSARGGSAKIEGVTLSTDPQNK